MSEDEQVLSRERALFERQMRGDESAHCFDWDGRSDAGSYVAPGVYRLRLTLEEAERSATSGEKLRIRTAGPPA